MLFAALCGSHVRNSLTPPDTSASASATAAELLGCALASSSGGLKSTWVSLLELCPTPSRSSARTRSDRGGSMLGALGARFAGGSEFAGSALVGAELPGRSPGKVLSRLSPSTVSGVCDEGACEEGVAGGDSCGFCCAKTPPPSPNNK